MCSAVLVVRASVGKSRGGVLLALSRSVVYDSSVSPQHCKPARLLCPWDLPGKNTGVGCHFLLRDFSTQGSNPHLLMSPSLAGRFFTTSTTWEGGGKGHNSTQDHINFKSFKNKSKPGALPPDERDTFSVGPQTFLSIQRTLRQKSVHFCQAESHGNLESGGKPKDLHLKREKQPMKLRLERHSPPSAGKPEGERKRGFPAKVLLKQLRAVAVSIKDVLFSKKPGTRLSLGRAGLLGNSFLISWESHRPLHSPCASVSSLVKVTFKELMTI